MKPLTKKELLDEIHICLSRNDVTQKEFVILNSLGYLLTYGYFPLEEVSKLTGDSIRVIQEHYSTPSDGDMRACIQTKPII